MKRFISIILILAAAALALTACDTADVDGAGQGRDRFGKPMLLHATLADAPATKTAVQANGTSVYWTPGDQLNVFHGSAYSGKFVSVNTEPAASADFGGSLDQVPGASVHSSDMYWAVYPYDADNTCDGSSVTLTLPSSQTAVAGTFAQGIFPAVAKSSTLDMSFRNVCGGACFTVATEGISSVVFKGRGGESLAGKVKVAFDASGNPVVQEVVAGVDQVVVFAPDGGCFTPGVKYYAVILPQTLSGGLDIIYRTSTRKATYSLERSIPVQRSAFGLINGYDAGLQFESMPIDRTMFPDQVFADYIFGNFDRDHDGVLSNTEMDNVIRIQVSTDNIVSVKGIEYFPNLEGLDCSGGRVYNQNTGEYDPTGLLASIDISANTALTDFRCPYNPGITEIDFSNNPELTAIEICGNSLTSIDISNCVKLESLNCENNHLQQLDVSMLPDLFELYCNTNDIASLDVSHNPKLRSLGCFTNRLTSLDLSGNPDLEYLTCSSNQISNLDLGSNTKLINISCSGNLITSLDLSRLSNLQQLYVYYNELGSLDVTHNPNLRDLDCENTGIKALDLSNNPQLTYLYCAWNDIETLDLSHNPRLTSLYAQNMKLTTLDLSGNPYINYLNCTGNPLGELYVLAGQPFRSFRIPDGVSVLTRAQFWSVIGDFNGWAADVDMIETSPGIWVSPAFNSTGSSNTDVKIRQDHDWLVNLGGEFQALGQPFAAIRDGMNISLPSGQVCVTLDVTDPLNPMVTVNQGDVEVVPSNQIWYTSTDGSVIEFYYAPNDPTDANVVSNTYSDGKGIITFDGTVTRLGQQAFSKKTKLSSIQLPSTLTVISPSSLGSTSLTQLDIPEGVIRLSNAALANNALLQRVYVPASLTNYGDYPFYGCPSLRRFEGPYATADGRGLICNNRLIAIAPAGLTSFNVPDGVERILTRAFYGYEGLTYISLPSSLLYINGEAFQGSGIVNITIPENVQNIYWGAFRNCTSLQSVTCFAVNPPAGGDGMFDNTGNCPILVPSGSVDAYKNADYWSAYADRIQAMPSALWSVIGEFNGWSADLDMAETSPGVFVSPAFNFTKSSEYSGFKLRKDHSWDVNLGGTFVAWGQPFAGISGGENIIPSESAIVTVTLDMTDPSSPLVTVNKATPPDNEIWYTSTDGNVVTPYRTDAGYYGGSAIVSNEYSNGKGVIRFDNNVTKIGANAFRKCSTLASIYFPGTLTRIEESAFSDCSSMSMPDLPASLTSIGSGAFWGCDGIVDVYIPDSVNEFGYGIFEACQNLRSFSGKWASADGRCLDIGGILNSFAYADLADAEYSLPADVTIIGDSAFRNCWYTGRIVLGPLVSQIGSSAFAYSRISSIVMNDNVESVGSYAFRGTNISELEFPATLSYIGYDALSSSYDKVTINAVTPPEAGGQIMEEQYDFPIYVPMASLDSYKKAQYWSDFADRIVGFVSSSILAELTYDTNVFISQVGDCSGSALGYMDTISFFKIALELGADRSRLDPRSAKNYFKYRVGAAMDSVLFSQLNINALRSDSRVYCFAPDGTEIGAFQNIFSQLMNPTVGALFTTSASGDCIINAITDKNIINDQEYNAFLGICRYDVATSKVVQIGF